MYLEILRFKIYIENYAKSKWEEQKKNEESTIYCNNLSLIYSKGVFGIKSGKEMERLVLKKGNDNDKDYCN